MTDLEGVSQLLAEVGPRLEDIEQIDQLTEDTWLVIFDEETAIEVVADPTGGKLSFSMLLGAVDESRAAELFPALLSYSFLKSETGGFHFGMDGLDGNVHLMLDVARLDLTVDELSGLFIVMLETGQTWRDALEGEASVYEEAAEADGPANVQV